LRKALTYAVNLLTLPKNEQKSAFKVGTSRFYFSHLNSEDARCTFYLKFINCMSLYFQCFSNPSAKMLNDVKNADQSVRVVRLRSHGNLEDPAPGGNRWIKQLSLVPANERFQASLDAENWSQGAEAVSLTPSLLSQFD
jgi:hypothetical protein